MDASDQYRPLLRKWFRAALPILLAPEVAKREAAERERDELRGGPEGPFPACHDCGRRMVWGYGNSPSWVCPAHVWLRMTAAEAERDRLKAALEEEIASRNAAIMGSAWYALPKEERAVLVALRLAEYNTREARDKETPNVSVDMTTRLRAALSGRDTVK